MSGSSRAPFPCPHCGEDSAGKTTGTGKQRSWIYRRRVCEHCGERYSTHERLALADVRPIAPQASIEDGGRAVEAVRAMRDVVASVADLVE